MIHPHTDAPLGAPAGTPSLDDDAWEDLLNYIEERRVIPIVGPELLRVETDAGPRLLLEWLAEKLAARLNVDPRELPQPYTLNDVVCWFLAARGRREEAYTRVRSILRETNFAPPRAAEALTLWDLEGRERLLTIAERAGSISPTAFSADGNVFAGQTSTGASAGRLHFWRAPSWAEIEAAERNGGGKPSQ